MCVLLATFEWQEAFANAEYWYLLERALVSPSSVKSGEANRDRLIETLLGRAFIFFVTAVKQDDLPGIKPDLTEEGSEAVCKVM